MNNEKAVKISKQQDYYFQCVFQARVLIFYIFMKVSRGIPVIVFQWYSLNDRLKEVGRFLPIFFKPLSANLSKLSNTFKLFECV